MIIKNLPEIIFLCGFMGTGKSTTGRKLARELDLQFLDLDDKIEERTKKTIPQIFDDTGEKGFRKTERQTVLEISRDFKGIVALGGGSLQNQHILDHIKLNGLLVFIETPISVILDRISKDKNRPLLLDEHGNLKSSEILEKELKSLYEKRLPLYEQADIKLIDDGNQPSGKLVKQLLKKIRNHVSSY